jgi:intracellular multiplication protein IcmV
VKKVFRAIGAPFKPFLNFSAFVGYKGLKGSVQNLTGMVKDATAKPSLENIPKETFEEAVIRLNLSEQDLTDRQKSFFRMSLFYVLLAVFLFAYLIYLLVSGVLLGVFISAVLVLVSLAFSYREHFWYTQMAHRRLGLTYQDWKAYTFGGRKK